MRASSVQIGALVREVFSERLVPNAQPPGNFSVFLAEKADGGSQEFHRLHACHSRTLRTLSASRLLATLWHELDCFDARMHGDRMLLDVAAVVRGGMAHLLPSALRRVIGEEERRWARDDFEFVDRRWLDLDLSTGTVTVPIPRLGDWESVGRETLPEFGLTDQAGPASPAGTFPIASWTVASRPLSPSRRVAAAGGAILNRQQQDGPRMIAGLAQLLSTLPVIEEPWDWTVELRSHLLQL